MTTILATSDLHGNLPDIKEPFDLLCICGDTCPANNHLVTYQAVWCNTILPKWFNTLPYRNENSKVIMIWGNHDFIGEDKLVDMHNILNEKTDGRVVVLNHEMYTWQAEDGTEVKIFGTPYCGLFGSWAFMKDDETLDRLFGQIPEGVDILLSHDSPNIWKMGAITQGRWKSDTTGNRVLPKHLERIKPRFFFSGHFHSGTHEFGKREGIWCANVSFVDENYDPVNPLLKVNVESGNVSHDYLPADCVNWKEWKSSNGTDF